MNDQDLDRLVSSAVVGDAEVGGLALDEVEAELCDAIMATPREVASPPSPHRRGPAPAGTSRPRRRVPLRALGAAAAAVAMIVVVALQPFGRGTGAWAEALVDAAEASPLLLVGEPGWTVTRADVWGHGGDGGEMTFTDANGRLLDLYWRVPIGDASFGESHAALVEDRTADADHNEELTVLGRNATLLRQTGTAHRVSTLFGLDGQTIEVRGTFATIDDYRRVLLSLERVDVDTWLSAMPESVIASADRAPVVREMLADVPLPAGFDVTALETGPLSDRYQLGAEVTRAVVCPWVGQWVDGRVADDRTSVDEATEAMRTSHDWAILNEMVTHGAWPEVVWEFAEAVAGDGTVRGGILVERSYRAWLGCDG